MKFEAVQDFIQGCLNSEIISLRQRASHTYSLDPKKDNFLEICILKNKFSIEKTKSKVEHYCTLKAEARYSYLFGDVPIPSKEPKFYAALPKLTKDFHRIIFGRLRNLDRFDLRNNVNAILYVLEVLARYDYSDGLILIYDFSTGTPKDLLLFRVNIFADLIHLSLKAHSARPKEIHIINKQAKIFYNFITPFIPSKYASRITLHDDCESLLKSVPAAYLPKDYGGDLKSLDEILADYDIIFNTNADLLQEYLHTKAIEKLRVDGSGAEEMQGTFKTLNID